MSHTGDKTSESDVFDDPGVFENYSRRLAALAARHLSQRLGARVDGEDIAQSAFRTFFRRNSAGEFAIDNSTDLWRLLAHITVLKARAHARHHMADKRAVGNEQGLVNSRSAALEPSDEDAMCVNDQIERVLHGLPDRYGEILRLLLEGCTRTEVARKLGLARMTIHRAIDVLKERLASESIPQK